MNRLFTIVAICACLGISPVNLESCNETEPDSCLNVQTLLYHLNAYAYPLPDNRCSHPQKTEMSRCELAARDEWNVRDTDFYTNTRKFCCYTWDDLRCQLEIAQYCDSQFASALSTLYDRLFTDLCESHGRGSASCALRWWSILLIVVAGFLIILAIILGIFFCVKKRRARQDELSDNESRTGSYTVHI